jgi:hypothetical protein
LKEPLIGTELYINEVRQIHYILDVFPDISPFCDCFSFYHVPSLKFTKGSGHADREPIKACSKSLSTYPNMPYYENKNCFPRSINRNRFTEFQPYRRRQ